MTFLLAGRPEGDVFVGRKAELARLADALARVRQGEPWLVTIEGESGVGKTALARRSLTPSAGLTALWARADPGEGDLEYGLIGQLLRDVDHRVLARYPLLVGDVVRSSPFAVGVQLLGIVGELQRTGPMALVIDDVQWADRRSVEALSFAFRRLSVDAVAVILIVRGDRDQLDAPTRRMPVSVTEQRTLGLSGVRRNRGAPLAAPVRTRPVRLEGIRRLYDRTG